MGLKLSYTVQFYFFKLHAFILKKLLFVSELRVGVQNMLLLNTPSWKH